jgi:hypothetical protein
MTDTHTQSTNFTNKLQQLMQFAELVIDKVSEADYLNAVNLLRDLYQDYQGQVLQPLDYANRLEFIQGVNATIRRDPVIHAHQRRAERPARTRTIIRDKAWVLKNGGCVCQHCDAIVLSKNLALHQLSDTCVRIRTSKSLVKATTEVHNPQYTKCITIVNAALQKHSRGHNWV